MICILTDKITSNLHDIERGGSHDVSLRHGKLLFKEEDQMSNSGAYPTSLRCRILLEEIQKKNSSHHIYKPFEGLVKAEEELITHWQQLPHSY